MKRLMIVAASNGRLLLITLSRTINPTIFTAETAFYLALKRDFFTLSEQDDRLLSSVCLFYRY